MESGGLSLIGLLFATATSVTNAVTDVARKKALETRDLLATSFAIKFFAMLAYMVALGARLLSGAEIRIKDSGPVFGFAALDFSPPIAFLIYLAIDVALVSCATLLYYRAVQVSPLSLCMPFIAFTPVFLIPTGYVLLGELPSTVKLVGVALVVVGSLVMHRQLFAIGWTEPIKAILREPGSRYMLCVAFIFSLTNPLDALLVRMSDAFTQAFAYGTSICLLFGVIAWAGKRAPRQAMREVPLWIILAGVLEATANILQFSSHNYIAVVITISLKRAGIVLVVLLGWLVFKERDITDKLIAATVMVAGALMFYLPMSLEQSLALAAMTLVGMSVALYLTRHRNAQTRTAAEVTNPVALKQED
jgi:drug/metabolite transporter (DMT)-like permease